MRLTPSRRILVLAAALTAGAFSSSLVHAQTTVPVASDRAIQLSEFTVNADSNVGYGASETMTGTRVATKIKDLPFQVNIITSEFFEDFAMFELNDNVAGYISNFSGLDQGGGFTLRGLGSTYQLRDGFFRLGRYGASNIDRIEVIKGPSAAIYGQSQPTGIVNIISKKPRKVARQTVRLSTGSYGTNREEIESTGPVGHSTKDFYVFTAQLYDRTYDTPFAAQHNKEAYLAWEHDFDPTSSLLVQVEYFLSVHHAIGQSLPLIQDPTTKQILGIDTRFAGINQGGPTQNELTRGMTSLTATFQKQFNDVWSTRVSGNYYRARRWDLGVPTSNYVSTTGQLTRGDTLGKGRIIEDGGGLQADLLAHTWLAQHAIENRDLFTIDINDYYRYDPSLKMNGPAKTAWAPFRTITVGQPITYWTAPFDYSEAYLTRMNKNRTTVFGGLFRHQSAFFHGRLLTYAGMRFDHVVFSLRDLLNKKQAHFTSNATTPNLGFNFKVRPNIATYVNYSQAFNPSGQHATASNITPNETGWGYDYGIKASYFEDRLNFTLGGFYIVKKNITETDYDPDTGFVIYLPEGTDLVRGVEFDGTWRFSDRFMVGGSFGHVNSQITNLGYQRMAVGRSPANVTPTQAAMYGKYNFAGPLQGLSVNFGVVYRSSTPTQNPNAGDHYDSKGHYTGTTGEWMIRVPAWAVWTGGIRYSFRGGDEGRLSHTIALNVNNLFDRQYLNGRSFGEGRAVYVTYTLSL
ncbi:MAG TPA: TonB-dependent receptor [Opitutaceae bacterium]|nr:TonB-dependent receptor [Opitutaceae bacterium]